MIFIDNKYTKWYNNIILSAKSRNLSKEQYKGKQGTGFGALAANPMKNPDSIRKMLETRKINRERRAAGNIIRP